MVAMSWAQYIYIYIYSTHVVTQHVPIHLILLQGCKGFARACSADINTSNMHGQLQGIPPLHVCPRMTIYGPYMTIYEPYIARYLPGTCQQLSMCAMCAMCAIWPYMTIYVHNGMAICGVYKTICCYIWPCMYEHHVCPYMARIWVGN